jgi:hypothetical protein
MRLIDAEEFEKRIKPYDTTDTMDKALYNFAHNQVICMPTVCDIEQIRAEIEQNIGDNPYKNDGIYCSLHVIDKYKGEHEC